MHKEIAVRFEDVSFSYGANIVLDSVRFHIHSGEFATLVGPNGAGKTTVLKLVLGLVAAEKGKIVVLGTSPKEARASIGYVPQNAVFDSAFPVSVSAVVRMGRLASWSRRFTEEDEAAVAKALDLAAVADLAGKPYSALSGGQRKRVLVARALAGEPRLLVLDEPTANMDSASESRLFDALGELKGKTTVLVVTHDTGFVTALTDAVFCVGERKGRRTVVRHQSAPARHVPEGPYGNLQVLHDTEVPEDACCRDEEVDR